MPQIDAADAWRLVIDANRNAEQPRRARLDVPANAQQQWEYTSENLIPGENRAELLRKFGENGWEAWHIETNPAGWLEIFFKRMIRDS